MRSRRTEAAAAQAVKRQLPMASRVSCRFRLQCAAPMGTPLGTPLGTLSRAGATAPVTAGLQSQFTTAGGGRCSSSSLPACLPRPQWKAHCPAELWRRPAAVLPAQPCSGLCSMGRSRKGVLDAARRQAMELQPAAGGANGASWRGAVLRWRGEVGAMRSSAVFRAVAASPSLPGAGSHHWHGAASCVVHQHARGPALSGM